MAVDTWTDERIAEVTRLYAEGFSCRHIGEQMGLSRNAVIGRIHRMGIDPPETKKPVARKAREPGAESKPRTPRNPKLRQKSKVTHHYQLTRLVRANGNSDTMRVMTSVKTALPVLRCVEILPRHLSLLDLEPGDCRYPYGDGPITFCGHKIKAGSSYCVPHHALTWVAPNPSPARARIYQGTNFARGAA